MARLSFSVKIDEHGGVNRVVIALSMSAACNAPAPGATAGGPDPSAGVPVVPTESGPRRIDRVELVTGVAAVVYEHPLKTGRGTVSAWTLATEGLAALSLPEWVVTVVRPPGRDAADYPRELLGTLAGLSVARGPMAMRAGMSALLRDEQEPLLAGTELRAMYFLSSTGELGVPLQHPSLTVVFMTRDEHVLGQELGFVRWAARIGSDASTFPTPWWVDIQRAPVLTRDELDVSLLSKVRHRYLVGTSVVYQPHSKPRRLTLTVEPVAVAEFQEMAREYGDAFALLVSLSRGADAHLVWRPGQDQPAAISAAGDQGERIGGNFLMIAAAPDANDEFRVLEDGFGLVLKPATWERLKAAIAAKAPLELPLVDAVFALDWPTTVHVDPTGVSYKADGVWNTYTPNGTTPPHDRDGAQTDIVLLTPEDALAGRITVEELAGYMKRLDAAVAEYERTTAGSRPAHHLVVDVELMPGRPPTISSRSDRASELAGHLPPLTTRLKQLEAPTVSASVHFLLQISLPKTSVEDP